MVKLELGVRWRSPRSADSCSIVAIWASKRALPRRGCRGTLGDRPVQGMPPLPARVGTASALMQRASRSVERSVVRSSRQPGAVQVPTFQYGWLLSRSRPYLRLLCLEIREPSLGSPPSATEVRGASEPPAPHHLVQPRGCCGRDIDRRTTATSVLRFRLAYGSASSL